MSAASLYWTISFSLLNPCDPAMSPTYSSHCAMGVGFVSAFLLVLPAAIPSFPSGLLIGLFVDSSNLIFSSVTPIKIFPILLITANTFLFWWLLATCLIRRFAKYENLIEKNKETRIINRSFLILGTSTFLFVSTVSFFFFPTIPFVSDREVISTCFDSKCFANFIHYKVPNCAGEKAFFVYPFKINQPSVDECQLNNFISQNPLKNVGLLDVEYPEAGKAGQKLSMVFSYFSDILNQAPEKQKADFCKSFGVYGRTSCEHYFQVLPAETDLTIDYCKNIFGYEYREQEISPMQESCINKYFPGFEILNFESSVLNKWYPHHLWEFSRNYGDPVWSFKENDSKVLDLRYSSSVQLFSKDSSGISSGIGEIKILEFPKTGSQSIYIKYFNIRETTYEGGIQRTDMQKIPLKSTTAYIESLFDPERKSEYTILHFVFGDTYVQIVNHGIKNVSKEDTQKLLMELAGSMIK